MILDPSGREVWVPDFLAPQSLTDMVPPPAAPPIPLHPAPTAANPFPEYEDTGPRGGDLPPTSRNPLTNTYTDKSGRTIFPYGDAPASAPRTDAARIGQTSAPIGTVNQIGQAQAPVVGGAAPSMGRGVPTFTAQDREDLAGGPPLTASAQDAATALRGVLGDTAGSIGGAAGGAAPSARMIATDAPTEAQRAAAAAYAKTPEGQIEQANASAAAETRGQAKTADQIGATEQAQLDAIAAAKIDGLKRAEDAQKRAEAWQQHWQARKEDAAKQIETAIQQEAAYKVDDNRRYAKMGTGQKIGFWISAALSGLGDALQHKSGPNMVLQMMQDAIKDDVASQWREKENLGKGIGTAKGRLDNFRQMAEDSSQAEQLHVATEYKKTADQIDAVAAKFAGPQAKLRAQQYSSALRVQADQIVGTAAEQKIARQQRAAELANQTAQVRIAGGHLALQGKQFEYQKEHDKQVLNLEAAKLDQQAKAAGDQAAAARAKHIAEHGIGGTTVAVMDPDGKPVMGPDGKPLLKQSVIVAPYAGSEKIKELQTQKAAADTIVNIMDETIRLREKYGWGSDLWKSKEFQEMKGNWAALKLELKDLAKLGVIAGPDEQLMNDFLGGSDPTAFRDPLAGMQNARNNVTAKYTNSLRSVGATDESGQPLTYAPPQQHYAAPAGTPEDLAFKESIKTPGADVNEYNAAPGVGYAQKISAASEAPTKAGAAQNTTIQSLLAKATDPKASAAQRDAAIARLSEGAQSGQDEDTRSKFRGALEIARGTRQAAGN